MRIAYFDTFSGISGDMALGAFINAGVSLNALKDELQKLPIAGYDISVKEIVRSMISATKVDITIHELSENHLHAHQLNHVHAHEDHHSYREITELIEQSSLSPRIKVYAQKIFFVLAKAEAKIHNVAVDAVHFHEVGAIDSIVDIVGIAICLDILRIDKIFSSVIRTGNGGFIETQHGTMPIPTPATVEILKNYPTMLTDIPYELTTPTGAAFLVSLSEGVLPSSANILIDQIGYGAGGKEIPGMPNLLRMIVGEIQDQYEKEEIVTIETNIDDMNPEVYPYVIEKLISVGAYDAYMIPIIMKKGRPGILLSCMCGASVIEEVLKILYRETTTLGVRIQNITRKKIPRDLRIVDTSFGPVKMKVIQHDSVEKLLPEFEECRRIAEKFSLPLREVYSRLEKESAK